MLIPCSGFTSQSLSNYGPKYPATAHSWSWFWESSVSTARLRYTDSSSNRCARSCIYGSSADPVYILTVTKISVWSISQQRVRYV